MDTETEQKDNKIQISEDKKGILDSKVVEKMIKLDLNKVSNKNYDRNMNRLNKTIYNHKYIKI